MSTDMHRKLGITQKIREYGQAVIGVTDDPPFAYTIGRHERGLPELVAVNLAPDDATRLLNAVDRGNASGPGDVSLGGAFSLRLRAPDDQAKTKSQYTIQVGQYYGTEEYRVLQVVVCDKAGVFPGEAGCAEPYCRMVLL